MKQITIAGNTYKSISAAWRAESPPGLRMITVRWRLNNGWHVIPAFIEPVVAPELRRTFNKVRHMHWMEAAER